MKNCLKCGYEVENDDNFCPQCGHWTARGYILLKDNNKNRKKRKIVEQQNRMVYLFELLFLFLMLIIIICFYRGKEILSPFIYVRRKITDYQYGYNTTILKTDNQYFNKEIIDIETAISIIKSDFEEQDWKCKNNFEIGKIEKELQENNNIINVSFCDLNIEKAQKISIVINDVYQLFPNIKNYLTNISITNDSNKNSYVASFQPIYQFVNSSNNINEYNKVNKTQILLNSYYFLNEDKLKSPIKEDWYVKDATWESLIAHELGHYINFVTLLKNKKIDNIILVTKENENVINDIIEIVNNQRYSKQLVNEALENYNKKYNTNLDIGEFTLLISKYANQKNHKNEYVYDEIIAESVHDYYLHKDSSSKASLEIIYILKLRLN